MSDSIPQRISILISLLCCRIIIIIIVVAQCKWFCKKEGDVTGQAQSLVPHLSALVVQQSCSSLSASAAVWSLKAVVHRHHSKLPKIDCFFQQ